jgi:hypothetical protein
MTTDKTFTEEIIKHYLEDRLYEKRGISRDEYIKQCKTVWEQTHCKEGDYKLIIDELYDYSKVDETTDYNDKLLTNHLKNKQKSSDIQCLCLVKVKWENGDIKEVPWDERSTQDLDDPVEPEERRYLFALFDVLGFEALHAEVGTTRLYQSYKELIDRVTAKDSFSTLQTFNEPDVAWTMVGDVPLRHHYFSDTIILWTPMLPEFVSPFCARCSDIICESILMGLPLRGAISEGSAILNKDRGVFLGSPLIEAARVEGQQNWIGVSFCPSSTEPHFQASLHPDLLMQNYTKHFKPVNGFNRYISLMTLDWPKRARERKIDTTIIQQLQNLKGRAPVGKQFYYEQTLAFIQHSRENDGWYKNYALILPKPLETVIRICLTNGDELEGALPDFAFKERKHREQYFLLIPKENIEFVKSVTLQKQSFNMEMLSRIMYVIPKVAIARQQLLREEPSHSNILSGHIREPRPKDLTLTNETISRIFVGAKNYEIFLPTLNTIHKSARSLIFVNYAIPEGETWNQEGIEILHKMELFSHRDFINAVDSFRRQVDLSQETDEFFVEFLNDYKKRCETFIEDIDGLLTNFNPEFKVTFAPEIMERERFYLLGLMIKMLCHLTDTKDGSAHN